jgi:malto-oligosyltrehalose synthase
VTRPTARRELGSTFRLQLNGLGFAAAADLVPALDAIGIETLYVSPITAARTGSTHGYDVINPAEIDPSLGGREGLESLLSALAGHNMRLLIDIVPNHMAATIENPFFFDVLLRGRRSRYASYFDIDWARADGKVVLCVLDGSLDEALDAGQIRVLRGTEEQPLWLEYGELQLPVGRSADADLITDFSRADDPYPEVARDQLERLLSRQSYLLADWRRAGELVNYRRFFDINDLIGVRQEDPFVFAATHSQVVELAAHPWVAGFRVDHVDGLRDPLGYLQSLRAAVPVEASVVVEKILEAEEALPDWPVEGTTGYEFAATVTALLTEADGAELIRQEHMTATADHRSFAERGVAAKRRMIDALFGGQFEAAAGRFAGVLPDLDPGEVAEVLREVTAQLSRYRTYRRAGEPTSGADLEQVERAADRAREHLTESQRVVLDRLVEVLVRQTGDGEDLAAVLTWQQLTGAVMAKGVEDTATYDVAGLLSTADVGTDPDRPAVTTSEFHRAMATRQRRTPRALNALSTHDSKRAHDVRCRIAVLSEVAEMWCEAVGALDRELAAVEVDPAERRYVYQTLVGSWPMSGEIDGAFIERIGDHVVKAAREAKRRTSWLAPDIAHEATLRGFVKQLMGDPAATAVELLETVVTDIEYAAATNSLASVVLRSVCPGVPDVYQNDCQWFLALVDPDNRAPIDAERLKEPMSAAIGLDLLNGWRDGRLKQAVLTAGLWLRRDQPALFATGEYRPLAATGSAATHVVAIERWLGDTSVVCVVPRLSRRLAGPGGFPTGACWEDTELALPGDYINVFTGHAATGKQHLSSLLSMLPVALLRSA